MMNGMGERQTAAAAGGVFGSAVVGAVGGGWPDWRRNRSALGDQPAAAEGHGC